MALGASVGAKELTGLLTTAKWVRLWSFLVPPFPSLSFWFIWYSGKMSDSGVCQLHGRVTSFWLGPYLHFCQSSFFLMRLQSIHWLYLRPQFFNLVLTFRRINLGLRCWNKETENSSLRGFTLDSPFYGYGLLPFGWQGSFLCFQVKFFWRWSYSQRSPTCGFQQCHAQCHPHTAESLGGHFSWQLPSRYLYQQSFG